MPVELALVEGVAWAGDVDLGVERLGVWVGDVELCVVERALWEVVTEKLGEVSVVLDRAEEREGGEVSVVLDRAEEREGGEVSVVLDRAEERDGGEVSVVLDRAEERDSGEVSLVPEALPPVAVVVRGTLVVLVAGSGGVYRVARSRVLLGAGRSGFGGPVVERFVLLSCRCCVLVAAGDSSVAEGLGGGATTVVVGPLEPGAPALPADGAPALGTPEVAVAIAANSVATPSPDVASCPYGRQDIRIGLLGCLRSRRQL